MTCGAKLYGQRRRRRRLWLRWGDRVPIDLFRDRWNLVWRESRGALGIWCVSKIPGCPWFGDLAQTIMSRAKMTTTTLR